MIDLADFLLARIAETEAAAKAATPGPWRWVDPGLGKVKMALVGDRDQMVVPSHTGDVYPSVYDADHITRWDPARVLAECEAKRRIVTRCQEMQMAAVPMAVHLATQTLTDMGCPYAGHPDYRPGWGSP